MKAMLSTAVVVVCIGSALASVSVHAADLLKPGDAFPVLTASDQHGVDYRFEPGTGVVLIAFEMATARQTNRLLADRGAEFLPHHHAVYIADIHGMPGIGRMFALPKMRRYPHRIILADAEHLLDPIPRRPDRVTVIRLSDAGMVQWIRFWNPETDPLDDYLR